MLLPSMFKSPRMNRDFFCLQKRGALWKNVTYGWKDDNHPWGGEGVLGMQLCSGFDLEKVDLYCSILPVGKSARFERRDENIR